MQFLCGNTFFFNFFQQQKLNLVAKIMQSTYLCVIFHVKLKKLPFLAVLARFLILGKIQDGAKMVTIVDDVTGLQ